MYENKIQTNSMMKNIKKIMVVELAGEPVSFPPQNTNRTTLVAQ